MCTRQHETRRQFLSPQGPAESMRLCLTRQFRKKWSVITVGEELDKQIEGRNAEQPGPYVIQNLQVSGDAWVFTTEDPHPK